MNDKILFVCTGNTCRSPMAMAIYNAVTKSSCACSGGISVGFPSGAAENARIAVKKYDANLEEHISRQLTIDDFEGYSKIITMTSSQKELLKSIYNDEKIITLSEFAGESGDIMDPYGGDLALYEYTAEMIYNYICKATCSKIGCAFAKEEDLRAIAEFEKEYFPDSWSEASINAQLLKDGVIVYKENNTLAGYCIFMTAADEGEILRIAVNREMRRKGIGSMLLSFALNEMKKNGCNEVFLEVRASNKAAISVYENAGFENIGIRKNYYKDTNEDAILYKLDIKDR